MWKWEIDQKTEKFKFAHIYMIWSDIKYIWNYMC